MLIVAGAAISVSEAIAVVGLDDAAVAVRAASRS